MELSQYTEGFAAAICLTLMVGMMLTFARLYTSITSLPMFLILDLEFPRAGFIRVDSADVLLRELSKQMLSTTDLQVPHD
jgi:hypothetical protein